jgi:hypothetical protein
VVGELQKALLTDIAWVRERTRLVGLAEHWARGGRPADRVMSPADIGAAERLLEGRPRNADPPPQVLGVFLAASRARLEEEMRRQRRTTGRALVKPVEEALKEGRHEDALRLAAAGVLVARTWASTRICARAVNMPTRGIGTVSDTAVDCASDGLGVPRPRPSRMSGYCRSVASQSTRT